MKEIREKKFRIRETKHLPTNADISTDTKTILLVRPNLPLKTIFARQFYTIYEQKFSNLRQLLSITFPQGFQKSKMFGLREVGAKRRLNGVSK